MRMRGLEEGAIISLSLSNIAMGSTVLVAFLQLQFDTKRRAPELAIKIWITVSPIVYPRCLRILLAIPDALFFPSSHTPISHCPLADGGGCTQYYTNIHIYIVVLIITYFFSGFLCCSLL